MNDKIFREYDIRGVADRDLTDEVAFDTANDYAKKLLFKFFKFIIYSSLLTFSTEIIHACTAKIKGIAR